MEIRKVTEKDKVSFNEVSTHPLQSWEWGEFREKAGNEIVRFSFGQVTLHKIQGTKYKIGAFIKGPMPTQEMVDELKDFAKKENLIFIKLEPNYVIKKENISCADEKKVITMLKKADATPGKTLFTPTTFWVDLTPSEEQHLKSFHSKTRYNIRYAGKCGVEIIEDNSDKAFERYLELTRETVKRQGFYAHTEKYHRLMWQHLHRKLITNHQSPIARLLTARYKNEIITTWIVFVWHDFLYYPYGASTEKYKNVMANNLMMWEAIRYGKKLGLKTFDLWGREEGKGFTKFKEGYNPKVVEFLGTWDLIVSPLYWPYRTAEFIRWQILRTKSKFVKPTF
jgi:lipid II:glycine glycyltransferase (peptidoglycan interpeptide bridge formation enzyme)